MTDEFGSATIVAILKNAQSLLGDAKILQTAESYGAAGSLAVLSMEESAKACLVYWKLSGLLEGDIKKQIRYGHIDKHKLFASHAASQLMIKALVASKTTEEFKRELGELKRDFLTSFVKVAVAEAGYYDEIKQAGFYVDVNDDLTLAAPLAVTGAESCSQAIRDAELAFEIAGQSTKEHSIMSGVYQGSLELKLTKDEKRKFRMLDRVMAEIREHDAKALPE